MTDYDLRTRKALRRVMLLEYGFGPETLQPVSYTHLTLPTK